MPGASSGPAVGGAASPAPMRDSLSPGRATIGAPGVAAAAAIASAADLAARDVRVGFARLAAAAAGTASPRVRPLPRPPRRRPVPSVSLSGTSVMERSPSVATRRPLRADPRSTLASWVMSVNWSATSIRSELVLPRKLITSTRTPISWTARMAGAKSPSPETTTAMSTLRAVFIRSTTSSMSRFALTLPSPYLRMSLLTTR